ncbi:uncharacterized protein C2845_PM02G16970 [Panicum miliaceum]|uniref:Proline-rich protein 4-like n=1 Tax=Panicum miliaceum TaxID=4540 RepID=A0A3L6SGD2_PANMI|nr:uncharacterized protein C2845_PM02G16970 [Panicum miliaceum]
MAGAPRGLLLGVCAALMVIAVATGSAASVVVGLAKCADCTRKNLKAEAAFRGLQVAIKCKNSKGDYESKAVGELDDSGAFNVPLTTDLHGADCLAQLHSAAGTPCPGQEPSRIVPQSESHFVVVPGKTNNPSAECASVTICGPIKKHFLDHFHKKPVPPKPKPERKPEPKPQPEYHPPTPTYGSPTPTYGSPTPIYHPPARHLFDKKKLFDHFHKDHDHHPFLDHFHKKSVPPKPKPEPKPKPDYHPPTPTYGSPTPIYHPPARHLFDKLLYHFHKDHDHHHFFDHFHKKPVPPKPEPKPQPEYHPPTPTYGSPTPIYHPPVKHLSDKKHWLDHFHKEHERHHFFDHFHKKPVPPKPKPEPMPKPLPEYHPPTPTYSSPTPTYGSPTPIYHPPAKH